jgi:hypothetical protein
MADAAAESLRSVLANTTDFNVYAHGAVFVCGAIIALVSFAFLIPLDSVPAVTGVSIIMAVAYSISVIAWLIVVGWYAGNEKNLVWLNTHLMFLIVLPATIGATAMNVTAVQNTRNLLAGQVTA